MDKLELYKQYEKLIGYCIKELHCKWKTEDEFQEYYDAGQIGLINAINKLDNSKEITTSYFVKSIKNEIRKTFYLKNMDVRKVNYTRLLRLDSPSQGEDNMINYIPDRNINIEEYIIKQQQYEILYQAINLMKPKQKELILNYYGFTGNKKLKDLFKNAKKSTASERKKTALKNLKKIYLKLGGERID